MKNIHRQAIALIQKDEWDAAHSLIQDYTDPLSCRIHAYLHRVEGDLANAGYWYRRANVYFPVNTLEEEFKYLFTQVTDS